jgi:flagellar biosynthesis/type III secretory pathway chaperone
MKFDLMLEQLLGLLSREAELYQSVLTVIDKEKEAVVRSELIALNDASIEKENIMSALRKSDEKRRRLVACLAESLRYPVKELTLQKLSQLVDEPFAGKLQQASRDLLSVVARVQAANQLAKQLFEHSQALLQGAFNLLNELLACNTVYYCTGNIRSSYSTGKCVCSDI